MKQTSTNHVHCHRKAVYTGTACIVLPLLVGLTVHVAFRGVSLTEEESSKLPFLIAIYCPIPFPVVACLHVVLRDKKVFSIK